MVLCWELSFIFFVLALLIFFAWQLCVDVQTIFFDTLGGVTVFSTTLGGSSSDIDSGYIMSLFLPPVGCLLMLPLAVGIYLRVVLTRQCFFFFRFHWFILCLFVEKFYELFFCHDFSSCILFCGISTLWGEFYSCCCTLWSCFRYVHFVAPVMVCFCSYILSVHPARIPYSAVGGRLV